MISLNRMRLITDVVVRLTVDSAATTTTNTVLPLTVELADQPLLHPLALSAAPAFHAPVLSMTPIALLLAPPSARSDV